MPANTPLIESDVQASTTPPSGWTASTLGEVADIRFSNADKKVTQREQIVLLCNYVDVYNHEYLTPHLPYMQASASQNEIVRFGVRRGDVIITKDSETPHDIGVPAIVDFDRNGYVCGYHLAIIRPDHGRVDPVFLAKQLQTERVKRAFAAAANGTTRYGLTNDGICNTVIWLPSLAEQRRAGEILRTLDESIRQTERVIEKLRRMKQGLLHDLLTRGLDDNGELRDPDRHPEQFKDSPLGRIPEEWKVIELRSVAKRTSQSFIDGDWIESPYITDAGIRLIQTGNIGIGEFLDKSDKRRFITEKTFKLLGCKWVYPGDMLICRLADPIGRACVVPKSVGNSITSVDCTIVRLDSKLADTNFMLAWVNSAANLKAAEDVAGGSTRQRISRSSLGRLLAPRPSLAEQQLIAARLTATDNRLTGEVQAVAKLRTLKHGLMDDLLTGRVRVLVSEFTHA